MDFVFCSDKGVSTFVDRKQMYFVHLVYPPFRRFIYPSSPVARLSRLLITMQ